MIIVKTTNGDSFIRDDAFDKVTHHHDTATVTCEKGEPGTLTHTLHTIQGVEAVVYVNDKQPTQWQDAGSILRKMQDTITQKSHHIAMQSDTIKQYQRAMLDCARDLEQLAPVPEGDIADTHIAWTSKFKDMGNKPEFMWRDKWEQAHPGEPAPDPEADLIATLQQQTQTQANIIADLQGQVKQAERLREIYQQANERIMLRNFWQRLTNKRTYIDIP